MLFYLRNIFNKTSSILPTNEGLTEASDLFAYQQNETYCQIDRLFGNLLIFQYILMIILAFAITSTILVGESNYTQPHVWPAILLEGCIISFPLFMIYKHPGQALTRHSIAIAQALTSIILIYTTGGRIETHFHIFGSLALLALYQDWRVLVTTTIVMTTVHLLQEMYIPLSSYSSIHGSEHNWVEHTAWVIFEDIFLIYSCNKTIQRIWHIANRQAEFYKLNQKLAAEVQQRRDSERMLQQAQRQLKGALTDQTIELAQANIALEKELAERKRLESQLVHAQKMESLGQLAAGVAHEINNPIGFVMSNLKTLGDYTKIFKNLFNYYAQLTQSIKAQPLSSGISEELSQIDSFIQKEDVPFILNDIDALLSESQEGTLRVQEIVKNLKSFARVDESTYKETNIHDCLETTLKVAHNELKYKCTIIKKFSDIPNIYCNPGQLNQVFINLLVNAAQAIETQGEITIETFSTPENVTIKISDTGSGIPKDKLSKIFDPFYTTKPVGKGTGLGLSISYGIIQEHGGTIDAESEVGQGTCFTICLPFQPKKEKAAILQSKVTQ